MVKRGNSNVTKKLSNKARHLSKKAGELSKVICKSKLVMYMTIVLAVVTILGFLQNRDYSSIVFFGLVSVMTYYFSKNVVVVLALSVVLSNLLKVSISFKEGMKEGKESKEGNDDDEEEVSSGAMSNREGMESDKEEECKGENCPSTKEKMSSINPKSLDDTDVETSYVDKSKTIENAYASLDNMIGPDGVNKLSKDTENLLKKQNQLINTVQHMGPMMDNMNKLVKGMDGLSGENGGLTNIMKSLNNITGNTENKE